MSYTKWVTVEGTQQVVFLVVLSKSVPFDDKLLHRRIPLLDVFNNLAVLADDFGRGKLPQPGKEGKHSMWSGVKTCMMSPSLGGKICVMSRSLGGIRPSICKNPT